MCHWRPLLILAILQLVGSSLGSFVLNVDHKFANHKGNLSAFKHHDHVRHRHLLGVVDLPLGGNGLPSSYGLYFAKIGIGNPSKDYYVQVDTGSDILWVNCIGCWQCPTKSDFDVKLTLYDPAASADASEVKCNDKFCKSRYGGSSSNCSPTKRCEYAVVYGDRSSTSGYFVRDMVQLREVSGNHQNSTINGSVVFGCGSQQGGGLWYSAEALDGILGFGQADSSMLMQLASVGLVRKVFFHCLDTVKGGGIFVIGETSSPTVKTTPMIANQSHYNVVLQSIEVNGTALKLPSDAFSSSDDKGVIIDSGTTMAYFPDKVYQQLLSMTAAPLPKSDIHVVDDHFQCFKHYGNIDDHLPDVTFRFQGSLALVARPSDYLFEINSNVYCFGWQSGGDTQDGSDITILGDLVLSNRLVVYDIEKQTIGWTDYNCSSSVQVKGGASSAKYLVNSHNLSSASRTTYGLCTFWLILVVFFRILL